MLLNLFSIMNIPRDYVTYDRLVTFNKIFSSDNNYRCSFDRSIIYFICNPNLALLEYYNENSYNYFYL